MINSGSPEAKHSDFSMVRGTYAVGDIKFTWDEFECPNCKRHVTVNEMKEIEGIEEIPLPKKSSKRRKILFFIFGILFLIAVAFLKKYL